ncbi:hypothetical protein COT51_03285 [candidate division WWE3 bacterium CG08_land_8_20_14_0_20_41_15]|uniref:Antitoxin n=1 Tax=candidate division WWE3 bacterium CG08_land_8_20_14_0_20_41_15 TaxID=1975086 RepID=A0A2H0X8T9_UNCKA|nr:MAG: hypothetical protein COT51_03285 [candidate division WWE3 bacterium CG08_land_8_20_14_0_20_41_15]
MVKQFINSEKFVNIQRAQAGLTQLLLSAEKEDSFYRVLKNDQPLGVLIPENLWKSFSEDIEALSSPSFRNRIAKARSGKEVIKSSAVKKLLGF